MVTADDIKKVVFGATKKWTKQRKAEERSKRARSHRRYAYSSRVCATDLAWDVIPEAYNKASGNGRFPAHARQIFYAARGPIQARTGRPLDSKYFTQNLLPRYINAHPSATAGWWVVYDARGHYVEPHTELSLPIGTLEVDEYIRDVQNFAPDDAATLFTDIPLRYPTKGPSHRFSAILFIEKEGFNPLLKAAQIAERFDLAIMSTKGQSVVAARRLVDEFCAVGAGIPVLVLHDFDKHGFEISQNLTEVSVAAMLADRVRYDFSNKINVVDVGLRLADVQEWKLESEQFFFKGDFQGETIATEDEIKFLRGGRRVELNAFTSEDFVKWLEAKLEENGVRKVLPDAETIQAAYRRAFHLAYVKRQVDRLNEEAAKLAKSVKAPRGLAAKVKKAIEASPETPWDAAIATEAARAIEEHLVDEE